MSEARAVRVAIVGAVLSISGAVSATEIRWTGDADCRRELEVREQVASMTGRDLPSVDSADFELEPHRADDGSWKLELKTVHRPDGAQSSRSLQGKTCVDVTDAAAVAIALAIGPEADSSGRSPPPVPRESKIEQEAPTPEATPGTKSAQIKPEWLTWFAGLGGALDSSVTPSLALGGALRLGLAWRPSPANPTRLRFELEGALYAPTESANSGAKGGKFQLGYAAPLLCAEKPIAHSVLLGCVGNELGQLTAAGSGSAITASRRRSTFWSAARAELGLLVPVASGLRIFGRAGVAFPLIRNDFVLDGSDVVFRPAVISFRGQVGLELSL